MFTRAILSVRLSFLKHGLCRHAVSVRRSVRLSVTFIHSVKTSNRQVAKPFYFFPYQTSCQYSVADPHDGGVECRWGRQKSRSQPISGFIAWCERTVRCYQHSAQGPWQVVTLTAGKRRRLLFTEDVDEVFMTRRLNVTPKTTEQHWIVRNDKSVAYVANSKRLRSMFCTIELTTDRHEASRGLSVNGMINPTVLLAHSYLRIDFAVMLLVYTSLW